MYGCVCPSTSVLHLGIFLTDASATAPRRAHPLSNPIYIEPEPLIDEYQVDISVFGFSGIVLGDVLSITRTVCKDVSPFRYGTRMLTLGWSLFQEWLKTDRREENRDPAQPLVAVQC